MLRLAGQLEEIHCPKGTYILKAGNVERSVFFVRKGIVRAFIEHGGREITFWFGLEGSAVVSLKSYINGQPGYETVECLEDTSLYVLRKDALEKLFLEDINIANWGRKFAEIEFLSTEEKFIPMLFTTASETLQRPAQEPSGASAESFLGMSGLLSRNNGSESEPHTGRNQIASSSVGNHLESDNGEDEGSDEEQTQKCRRLM